MCRIMEELTDESRAEGRLAALVSSVRQLMANGNLPLEKAMDLLGIEGDDRAFVSDSLGK